MENLIEKVLLENIKEQNVVFVFPTQISAELWADRIILKSDVSSVAMERFVAWDDFKGDSIKSSQPEKKSVPSTMRRFFAAKLISENAEKPFLKDIITKEHAKEASGFEKWIAALLPALSMWKKFFSASGMKPDAEDEDLSEIYRRYSSFLDSYGLFDPAWETPPFRSDGRKFVIFFPEILSDWFEYEKLLSSSPDIKIVSLPENSVDDGGNVYTFSDSRAEIKTAARYIRSLHENDGIGWTDIAVSVPDMESYGSYVEREFSLFEIPCVMRYARALGATSSGNLFSKILECYSSDFSYESVKNLLLNTELPWKDRDGILQLVDFGQKNSCICAFVSDGKKIDVWEESFARSFGEERALSVYRMLKSSVKGMVKAESFSKIRENYFRFRESFFDMEKCPEKSNRIISRCISELGSLIDLERDFPECNVPSPYSFFVSFLNDKNYLEQTEKNGVQVLPYRLSETAPFSAQIVLDASQSSLSVVYKKLSFLREDKRLLLLGKEDLNVTEKFISLYRMNSLGKEAYFSTGKKTFSGYAQPVSSLKEIPFFESEKPFLKIERDFYKEEKDWYRDGKTFPSAVTSVSKIGNEAWIKNHLGAKNNRITDETRIVLSEAIRKRYKKNEKVMISSTELNKFFSCPRNALLRSVVKIKEQENEAELVNKYDAGNINHKVMDLYFSVLKNENLPVRSEGDFLSERYAEILKKSVNLALETEAKKLNYLAEKVVLSSKDSIFHKMADIIKKFSNRFEGYSVDSVEKDFVFETEDFTLSGRIDCILRAPVSRDYLVIDYKTNKLPETVLWEEKSDGTPSKIPDFQMPVYFYLLRNQNPPIDVRNGCFYKLSDGSLKVVAGDLPVFENVKNLVEFDNFSPTMQKFEECLKIFSDSVNNGVFSAEGFGFDWNTCIKCRFRGICRKTFNVGRA